MLRHGIVIDGIAMALQTTAGIDGIAGIALATTMAGIAAGTVEVPGLAEEVDGMGTATLALLDPSATSVL